MIWRAALGALSAAAAGLELGRRAARKAIDDEAAETTAEAIAEARARIAEEARLVAADILRRFLISTAVKAAIALALWGAWRAGWIGPTAFGVGFGAAVIAYWARDLYLSWPALKLVWRELRRSRWRPRTAFADYVARRTEAEALDRAGRVELGWRARIALALAGRRKTAIASEIAATTAAAVRETSWRDIRPMALASVAKAAVGFALYATLVAVLAASVG